MYVEQIANFSVLPLEDVTVSIMYHYDWKGRPENRWTREELREWSERVKTQILGPYTKLRIEGFLD